MSRDLPTGTPTRAEGYVMPQRDRRPLWVALGVGGVLVVALIGLYFVGVTETLSPGPVAGHHAPIGDQCVLCHATTDVVEDLRCERCHDFEGTARLSNAAHVLLGSRDPRKAERAETVACTTCHLDHRGVEHDLDAVDDRECGVCHEFAALDAHPEFAARTAQVTTGLGLKFPHDKHIREVRARTGSDCEPCHVATGDLGDFEPISFDLHCASCHTGPQGAVTGTSGRMPREHLIEPERVVPPWSDTGVTLTAVGPAVFGLVEVSGMIHRDPWVTYNAVALRRSIDPEADALERRVLESQLAWLEQQQRGRPLGEVDAERLESWAADLEARIVDLEARLDAGEGDDPLVALAAFKEGAARTAAAVADADPVVESTEGGSSGALEEIVAALRSLGSDAAQRPLEPEATAAAGGVVPPQERFEQRRRELLAVLDAIAGRGHEELAGRAADLRDEVEGLEFDPDAGDADPEALQARLDLLDTVFRAIGQIPDPAARVQAARIDELRGLARQRVGGGLAPGAFERRRAELLDLLSAIEGRAGQQLQLRIADLRQRVLSVRPGGRGDELLARRLEETRRLLDRVRLEIELEAAGVRTRPVAIGFLRGRAAIRDQAEAIRDRLRELRRGPRPTVMDPADRAARAESLDALLQPCQKCHQLRDNRLARVRIMEPVMPRADFDHAPHVTQVHCDACHGTPAAGEEAMATGVYASKNASDLNSPGVANCQTCHMPSGVSAECEVCHRYHPRSLADLLETR